MMTTKTTTRMTTSTAPTATTAAAVLGGGGGGGSSRSRRKPPGSGGGGGAAAAAALVLSSPPPPPSSSNNALPTHHRVVSSSSSSSSSSCPVSSTASNTTRESAPPTPDASQQPATVVIAGAGIVGLVLALALYEHVGITAELYEKASHFQNEVGAGMSMYPNGLRVLRDIDAALLEQVLAAGQPYQYRRWERHDGTEIMTAHEDVLSHCGGSSNNKDGKQPLPSMGIRRFRLQNILYNAVVHERKIPIYFHKEIVAVETISSSSSTSDKNNQNNDDSNNTTRVRLTFADGTARETLILFGADGSKSAVRQAVTAQQNLKLNYTGITSLMGIAERCPKTDIGISFPSSITTQCHAVFFPTGATEQCFQFHFPVSAERYAGDTGSWGTLSTEMGQEQCRLLAQQLQKDGWHEKYLLPLQNVLKAVRIGFVQLEPRLERWTFGKGKRIVLLGDAAHPPLPFLGQGGQQGLEDAGTIALLLQALCLPGGDKTTIQNHNHKTKQPNHQSQQPIQLQWQHFSKAMQLYEQIRIARANDILDIATSVGDMQQKRAASAKVSIIQEELIQRQVFFHETSPSLLPGVQYDYRHAVQQALPKAFVPQPHKLGVLPEEEVELEQQ